MPSQHALLSPSAAERWIECPASIRMAEKFPDGGSSSYADEGTAAHALGEIKVSLEFGLSTPDEATAARRAWEIEWGGQLEAWDMAEMERHTDAYVALIREKVASHEGSVVMVEQRLNTGIQRCWGTSDIVIVSEHHIEIVDLKYGAGIRVWAEGNPQLRLYALGALDTFGDLIGDIERVVITVYQPRIGDGHADSEVLSPEELRQWREEVARPAAELALSDGAPFGPSETACKWCPASGNCKAQLEQVFAQDFDEDPELLTGEDMSSALQRIPLIRAWLNSFEQAALSAAYSEGKDIPGYKVVISGGRRSVTDFDGLKESLFAAGYSIDQFTQTKPVGIGELEKLLGKDKWSLVEDYVKKSEGKPSLVPLEDKRSAASPDTEAAKEFKELDS